jgi:transcriptional regulator with XRE-family HTH domain
MKKEFRYGKKIKEMREARAWTQEQLAEAADIETRTVQRVERGLTKSPETLQAIAGAFNVDIESLRSTWLIPKSRLTRTHFVDSYERFVGVEEKTSMARLHPHDHGTIDQGRSEAS